MNKSKKKLELSDKQKQFCLEYIKDYNGAQAAIRAGYSKKTAKEQATRLLTKDHVSEYLNELKDEIKEQTLLSIKHLDESILLMVKKAKDVPVYDDDGKLLPVTAMNFQGMGKALELYGKRLCAYMDKINHSSKDGTLKPVIYIPDNGRDKKNNETK